MDTATVTAPDWVRWATRRESMTEAARDWSTAHGIHAVDGRLVFDYPAEFYCPHVIGDQTRHPGHVTIGTGPLSQPVRQMRMFGARLLLAGLIVRTGAGWYADPTGHGRCQRCTPNHSAVA